MHFHSNVHMNMTLICCCVILLCQDLLLCEHSSFFHLSAQLHLHNNVCMSTLICFLCVLRCQNRLLRELSSFLPPPFLSLCKVLECGWAILQKDVSAASDLDQIIEAHSQFLSDITTRCLLDLSSQVSAVGPMALRLR